jgi:DNA-binding NarL/FixJ family response regulator
MPAPVLVLVDDMIFESKIAASATALGVTLGVIRDPLKVVGRVTESAATTLIVDLSTNGDPVEAIRAAKAMPNPPRVVAYGSHVEQEMFADARRAGADEVLARSQFVQRMTAILGG